MNHGLLNRKPQFTDWVAGAETGITLSDISSWLPYLSKGEPQFNSFFDTLACTHFGSGHIYETFIIYLLKENKLSEKAQTFFKKFLKDPNDINSLRVSKQFSAIKGGNTKQGNYVTNAWDTWRKIGAIPDSMLNTLDTAKTWEEYHNKNLITPEMEAVAKESLEYIDVMYQWVMTTSLKELAPYLKTSPLNNGIPQTPYTNHSVVMYGVEDEINWDLFNTYPPFLSKVNYGLGWVCQGVVTPKTTPIKPKIALGKDLSFGMDGIDVYNLQLVLVDQGFLNKNLLNSDPSKAYYGINTQNGVKLFQSKYGVVSWGTPNTTGYGRCGLRTRTKINSLYS